MTRLLFILAVLKITQTQPKDENIFIMYQYIKGCTLFFTMTLKYAFIPNIRSHFPENY